MMNSFMRTPERKVEDRVSLPSISPTPSSSATRNALNANGADSQEKSFRKKGKSSKNKTAESGSESDLVPDPIKPVDFDYWVRCMDINQDIYYYNSQTGESTWLAPCSICHKHADKWCQDCHAPYCDKHFAKKHNKNMPNEPVQPHELEAIKELRHKWSTKEIPRKQDLHSAQSDGPKCIECHLKSPTKMCLECWDPYCSACFDLVHHVGSLKYHKTGLYDEVIKGWVCVRTLPTVPSADNEEEGEDSTKSLKPDRYYFHSKNNVTTYEKPVDLMNDLEKTLYKNYLSHKEQCEKLIAQLETIQYDVEKARYERDQLLVEKVQWMSKEGANNGAESGKGKKGGVLVGLLGGKQEVGVADKEYYDKLMNPSDRKRGEGRSNYIKSLLNAPLPTK